MPRPKKRPPYIAVTLDAIELFEEVAVATDVSAGDVSIGCLRLWRHCFRQKTEWVTRERVATCYPTRDLDGLLRSLVAVGFLEVPASRPDYRVRGAEDWLGINLAVNKEEAGRKGGKVTAALGAGLDNLRQNVLPLPVQVTEQKCTVSGTFPEAKEQNGTVSGTFTEAATEADVEAVTAISQQQLEEEDHPLAALAVGSPPSENSDADPPPPPPPPAVKRKARRDPGADDRHGPLVRRLTEIAREDDPGWAFAGGRDAKVVERLLARSNPEEIAARWRRARNHSGFPQVRELPELEKFFGHFPVGGAPEQQRDVSRGYARADSQDWSTGGGFAELNAKRRGGG